MARKDLFRGRLRAARDKEDRLSELPDDLLLLILRRLDSRTAHGTVALSRRWTHLPQELTVLDLRVADALPERYRRCILHRREARKSPWLFCHASKLTDIAGRYQRRATRSMVASVRSLLLAGSRRGVDRLSLEFFSDITSACVVNSLVVEALDSWGVKYLVVVATPTERIMHPHPPVYSFPQGCISKKPGESRLQSLMLANCLPRHSRGSLRSPCSSCKTCPNQRPIPSTRGELVVDSPLMVVELRSLPKLRSLAVLHASLLSTSGAFLCLEHASFVFSVEQPEGSLHCHLKLENITTILMLFFQAAVSMTDLALRFGGPGMWIALKNPVCTMANVRRLLIADVPSCWDVVSGSGPHLLIDAAPLLESIHVHVQKQEEEPDQEIPWLQPSAGRHHRHLKELVVIGFQRTERHLHLVRYAMEVSTALSRVALFKHGHVKEKGPCGWEMVTPQSKWSNEEKLAVLDRICSPTAQIEVVLG
ncbi:hypothetical protein ACQ4PT_020303 [Festuca glaucescens]